MSCQLSLAPRGWERSRCIGGMLFGELWCLRAASDPVPITEHLESSCNISQSWENSCAGGVREQDV